MAVHILGIDLSLNHSGFVLIDAGTLKPVRAAFVTTKVKAVKSAKGRGDSLFGYFIPKNFNHSDANGRDYGRLCWWFHFFESMRKDPLWRCSYVGIEDYVYHGKSGSFYQIGELGSVARLAFRRCRLRYHEPMTIKIFATGKGNAKPIDTENAVRKRWRVDYRKFNGTRSGQRPSEDIATAYAVARIVGVERKLRQGKLTMGDLQEREIRVFNRVTKSNPVNILARDWIEDPLRKEGR